MSRTYEEIVATRFTTKQRHDIERAAKRAGLDLGTWLRVVALAASGSSTLADDLARARKAATS